MPRNISLIGKKFGRLTVIRKTDIRKNGQILRECLCDCGNTVLARSDSLQSGNTNSCGCLLTDTLNQRNFKHGLRSKNTYSIWNMMIQRCENPNNKAYGNYGGRGIKVCQEWHDFEQFYADMGDKPDGKELDRIDNNGDYTPSNCRWATLVEQANNKRTNVVIEYEGEVKTLAQWASYFQVDYKLFWSRHKKGWSMQDIIKKSNEETE